MRYFKELWKDGYRTFEGSRIGFNENHNGYIEIYEPNHPNSKSNGWIKEHRYIMSLYLNRPLKDNEVVHHKNKWKKDNRIENLELLLVNQHDRINYKHLGYTKNEIYCYLCGSDKTYMVKNTPNWQFDIDNKIICGACYGYIRMRYKKRLVTDS